ncbi:MAG: 16S rRNA (adenine(1518)-N(6)/adenine(1519)-N(6))-dimethyltransferase RsmA [Planctomycetota bacterium]
MTHDEQPAPAQPRQTTAYLKDLFAQVGFTIDARRGQNFLVDLNLLDLLARTAGIGPDDVVLEVGTGTGALTERLAAVAARVVTAEIDPRLAQLARDRLVDFQNVTLVEGDVLAAKHRFAPAVLETLDAALAAAPRGRFLLVANLPYCVATPVISNLLARPRPFDAAVVTVQREMAERMTAAAGSHSYNALSVWVGAQCRGEIVRILPPSVFWPRPKVDSAIVRLDLEPERRAAIADLHRFHAFVRDVFCHRRKLLRGVLVRLAGGKGSPEARQRVERAFAAVGLGPDARAEEIEPDRFVRLERAFHAPETGR